MTAKEMIKPVSPLALQGKALEQFVVQGDLAVLSPADKAAHYIMLCESLGLNPATKPFEYVKLQGKETLYARRECTDQLRKIHSVSIVIVSRNRSEDVYMVTARATLPDGRCDESIGVLSIAGLKGETLANALMKCETKAKRRVTLSICGLGFPDESEIEGLERDNFAELAERTPDAKPKAAVVVVKDPPEVAEPKAQAAGELPPIPKRISVIPAQIMKTYHSKLVGLGGIKLDDMSDDDLSLVAETMYAAHEARLAGGKTSQLGLDWLTAIAAEAQSILSERTDPAPPVDDAPPHEDNEQGV